MPSASELPALFDERSRPDFREVYGALARRATGLDVAVGQIRIAGLDLRPEEVGSIDRIRLVLAEVNGLAYRADAEVVLAQPERAGPLLHLVQLLEEGRVEIRSAPLAGWSPDFSLFHASEGEPAALVGPHWFVRPYPHRGPALTSVQTGSAVALLRRRFEELWAGAHEIGPAIARVLRNARSRARPDVPKPLLAQGKTQDLRDTGLP